MKQLILLFALIMAASPVRAVSFDDIIDQVRVDLHDNGSSDTYRYPQADMVRAANFIHSEICREAKIPQASYSTTTIADQAEYSMPSDIIGHPLRVSYYNSGSTASFRRLTYVDLDALDTENWSWESASSGLPREYYLKAGNIGLKPAPSASYSTTTWNTLNVYYNQDPTDITTSTTSLATSPFGGQSQYQSYGNILVTGIKAMLTGQGYDLYYATLSNLSETVKANYDRFIREPDRRSY